MPVDPQARQFLDQIAAVGGAPLEDQTVDEARAAYKVLAMLDGEPEQVRSVESAAISGPAGDIPVRIYTPTGGAALPLLVWYHGGGWVIGDLDTADGAARKLANRAGAIVVSVEYRLAPEHRFPAAVDDCWAALQWVHEHGASLGGDPDRIAVGGDSAGGNLAAVVSLLARDHGSPNLRYQLLVYPATDLLLTHPSMHENGDGYLLTRNGMAWFVDHYLGEGGDAKQSLASPFHADDLTGVAPALIITAEFDPLRDEGEAYGERLREAGVDVTVERWDGMIHQFFSLGSVLERSNEVVDRAASALRRALA